MKLRMHARTGMMKARKHAFMDVMAMGNLGMAQAGSF